MIQADLNILLPEIVLAVYAMLGLLGAVYTGKDRMAGMLVWLTAGLFVVDSSSLAPIVDSAPRDIWTPVGQLS